MNSDVNSCLMPQWRGIRLVVFPALTVAKCTNSKYDVTQDAAKGPETSLRQLNVVLVTYI